MMTKSERKKCAKELTVESFFFPSEIEEMHPQLRDLTPQEVQAVELVKDSTLKLGNKCWNITETVAECWPGLRASVARHYALLGRMIYTGRCYKNGKKADIVVKLVED